MLTAKIFTTGGSQAVRLPKQYRLSGKEVHIKRVDGGLLLIDNTATWKPLIESMGSVTDDFMKTREQLPIRRRKKI